MSVRAQVLIWTAQRISAAVLAVCVVVHLVTIIYAVRNGLSAAEILDRTRELRVGGVLYTVRARCDGARADRAAQRAGGNVRLARARPGCRDACRRHDPRHVGRARRLRRFYLTVTNKGDECR